MRKSLIFIIVFCLQLIFITACSGSDDDNVDFTAKNLVGVWRSFLLQTYTENMLTGKVSDIEGKEYTSLFLKLDKDGSYENDIGNKGSYYLTNDTLHLDYYYDYIKHDDRWIIGKLESDRMILKGIFTLKEIIGDNIIRYEKTHYIYTLRRLN